MDAVKDERDGRRHHREREAIAKWHATAPRPPDTRSMVYNGRGEIGLVLAVILIFSPKRLVLAIN